MDKESPLGACDRGGDYRSVVGGCKSANLATSDEPVSITKTQRSLLGSTVRLNAGLPVSRPRTNCHAVSAIIVVAVQAASIYAELAVSSGVTVDTAVFGSLAAVGTRKAPSTGARCRGSGFVSGK